MRWSHFYVEVVIEDAVNVGDVRPVEQQHLLLPLFKVFEPSLALPKPLTGDVVLYVLDALDGVVWIDHRPHSVDAFDRGHLVEETGGHILVDCPTLVGVIGLIRVEGEDPALFLPDN